MTSLCKAGVEITSPFLVGLRIIRIAQTEVSEGVNGVCSPKRPSLTSDKAGDKGVLSQSTGTLCIIPGGARQSRPGSPSWTQTPNPPLVLMSSHTAPGHIHSPEDNKDPKYPKSLGRLRICRRTQRQTFKYHTVGL